MENMKLISMVDFVLYIRSMTTSEICKTYPKRFSLPVWKGDQSEMVKDMLAVDAIKWDVVGEYAKFLKQPLELWMFVPVDSDGSVLEEPHWTDDYESENGTERFGSECEEYRQAKSRCLFEGFEVDEVMNITCGDICSGFYYDKGSKLWKLSDEKETIEDLVPYGLTLTAMAIKKLGL